MFNLIKISDLVRIQPEDFGKQSSTTLEDNINAKYANRVIQKIGLCICLYDLLDASEGLIGHGTGIVNVNVVFRLIVFRPFKYEILSGVISSSALSGIRIRTDFFDEIHVPPHMLPENTYFDHNEQVWIWKQDDPESPGLYFDNHESVRFKIESENWVDQTPIGPIDREEGIEKQSPYQIFASMAESGLGPCLWWDGDDDPDDEEHGE